MRHQLLADELTEYGRAAHAGRNFAVFGAGGWAGEVAAALSIFDADQDERPHRAVARQHLHQARHVQKILTNAAIGHMQHRSRKVARAISKLVYML